MRVLPPWVNRSLPAPQMPAVKPEMLPTLAHSPRYGGWAGGTPVRPGFLRLSAHPGDLPGPGPVHELAKVRQQLHKPPIPTLITLLLLPSQLF